MRPNSSGTIRGLGETNLISVIRGITGRTDDNDVEFVEMGDSKLALKIDGLSLTTSRMPFMDFYDMGWKVMASIASDFLVKLSRPLYAVVSITLRGDVNVNDFKGLVRGLNDGARRFGMKYLGGDLNEGSDNVIDVAAIGLALGGFIGRAPRVGDALVTIPQFGYTGLVFKLYYGNELSRWVNLDVVRRGIEMLRRPEPRVNMLDELLRLRDCISAGMDSSDGLGKVLWTMASDGGVRIEVEEVPTDRDLTEVARNLLRIEVEEVVFNGGEEFLPVFSVRRDCLEDFNRLGFREFARVEEGEGVYYGGSPLRYRGWDYFIGWTS